MNHSEEQILLHLIKTDHKNVKVLFVTLTAKLTCKTIQSIIFMHETEKNLFRETTQFSQNFFSFSSLENIVTATWTFLVQFPVSSTFGGSGKIFSEVNLELLLLGNYQQVRDAWILKKNKRTILSLKKRFCQVQLVFILTS